MLQAVFVTVTTWFSSFVHVTTLLLGVPGIR